MQEEIVKKEHVLKKPLAQSLVSLFLIFGTLIGFLAWQYEKGIVSIENSYLSAPVVNFSPTVSGTLNALYVKEGDRIEANTEVAIVGSQIITTKEAGVVTYAPNVLGAYFSSGQTVVSLVKNQEMKVIGSVEETKGLIDILPGQKVTFTVDAFPSKEYQGIVEKVSNTSEDTGVAFSISDKRPIKKFNVTVRFNNSLYPELKNGMSAKMTIDIRK